MKPEDQIAAEAAKLVMRHAATHGGGALLNEFTITDIIQFAIEKAYQAGVDGMADWNKANTPRAAHASEQGAVYAAAERLIHECSISGDSCTPFAKDIALVAKFALSQRPTPATANEEADNKAMRIVSEQQRKPDSASAGTTQEQYNELARKTPREAKSPLSATPSGGGEWTVDGDFVCMEDGSSCLCANAYQAQAIADAHNQSLHPRDTVSENEWFDDSPAAKKPDSPLVENYLRMFVQDILHGDEDHRKWLLESVECFIEGKHIPERP